MTHTCYDRAPRDLCDAFADAIELDLKEVEFRGQKISLERLCGLLWNSTAILPQWIANDLNEPRLATYAAAARECMAQIRRRAAMRERN